MHKKLQLLNKKNNSAESRNDSRDFNPEVRIIRNSRDIAQNYQSFRPLAEEWRS